MSQQFNYFKIGETVFYRGKPYLVKTLMTINECGIIYTLIAVDPAINPPFKSCMVDHTDKNLLSHDEYLVEENRMREEKIKHENSERMWELVRGLKNISVTEKDRLLVSIEASRLNTRNPYLDIIDHNSIKQKWEPLTFVGTRKLDNDWGTRGFIEYHTAREEANRLKKEYLNSMYGISGIDSFESPLVKELRENISKDIIQTIKEAQKMAEQKKKEMSITINEKERIVTVVFEDGTVRMSRCSKEDHFDPVIGVAMCIAARKLGSRTKLKKFVSEHGKYVKVSKKVEKKDENSEK